MNDFARVRPFLLIAFAVMCLILSPPPCASARGAKVFSATTLVETANYLPCGDKCSALAETASAFCFRMGDQFFVGDGRSYLHENKFSGMEELSGGQFQLRYSRRYLWIKSPDGNVVKIERGSLYENFKNAGCISEVHRPILAEADAHKRPAKLPGDAFALAGPGKGEFPSLFLWFDCTLESDKATITCNRWYPNGDFYGKDWFCARTMEGAPSTTEFDIDPLLSQDGRLVLHSGAVLRHDGRARTNDVLDRPGEACR
jgi:hypothetical protein